MILPLIDENMGFSLEGSLSTGGSDFAEYPVLTVHGHDNTPEDILQSHVVNDLEQSEIDDYEATQPQSRRGKGKQFRRALLAAVGSDPFTVLGNAWRLAKLHLREGMPPKIAEQRSQLMNWTTYRQDHGRERGAGSSVV